VEEEGIAVSLVLPVGPELAPVGEFVPGAMVPDEPSVFGYVVAPPFVLPGTVVPPGFDGVVAAGGCEDDPPAPIEPVELPEPVCAAQNATSAA